MTVSSLWSVEEILQAKPRTSAPASTRTVWTVWPCHGHASCWSIGVGGRWPCLTRFGYPAGGCMARFTRADGRTSWSEPWVLWAWSPYCSVAVLLARRATGQPRRRPIPTSRAPATAPTAAS